MVLALILISIPIINASTQNFQILDLQSNAEQIATQELERIGVKLGITINIEEFIVMNEQNLILIIMTVSSPLQLNATTANNIALALKSQYLTSVRVEIRTIIQEIVIVEKWVIF